jgi:hypothetical protein
MLVRVRIFYPDRTLTTLTTHGNGSAGSVSGPQLALQAPWPTSVGLTNVAAYLPSGFLLSKPTRHGLPKQTPRFKRGKPYLKCAPLVLIEAKHQEEVAIPRAGRTAGKAPSRAASEALARPRTAGKALARLRVRRRLNKITAESEFKQPTQCFQGFQPSPYYP